MRQVSNLPEQVIESPETSQIQPTKKPKRIFSKLVLVFGILGEFYLALVHLALYLNKYTEHHQTATLIFSLLGLKKAMGYGLSAPTSADGLFVCVMYFFYFFFLFIPTLRLLCFLCFIYVCLQLLLFIDNSFRNNDGNKTNRLLIAIIIVWLIYYIAFFQSFSLHPFKTTYSWPLTPWLK